MPGTQSIVSGADIVLEEYERVNSFPSLGDMWIDWNSDWDHGAEWKVMPVYLSKEMMGSIGMPEEAWSGVVSPLSLVWSGTWSLVFDNFSTEDICWVAFSKLGPGQELAPHKHHNPGHRIFHMGVDIPEGDVGISTSSGDCHWKAPKDWILFDDNHTHSAWNRTDKDRVIFYIDFKSDGTEGD